MSKSSFNEILILFCLFEEPLVNYHHKLNYNQLVSLTFAAFGGKCIELDKENALLTEGSEQMQYFEEQNHGMLAH